LRLTDSREDIPMIATKLFAEKGTLGSADAKAALSLVRNLIQALVRSGALEPHVIAAVLDKAKAEIGTYNNDADNEARRLIAEFVESVKWSGGRS
jgi:hypothetical protein